MQTLTFTITLEKALTLGVTFTREQTQAAAITLTPEQVAALEDALTADLAWKWGILTTPEDTSHMTTDQPHRLGFAGHQPLKARQIPFAMDRLSQKWKDFPPPQKFTPFPTHVPPAPTTGLGLRILSDSGKLEESRISPTYRQMLQDRGQVIAAQHPAPGVTPTMRQLRTPEAPPTPRPALGPRWLLRSGETWPQSETPFGPRPSPGPRVPHISREGSELFVPEGSDAQKEFLVSGTFPYQAPAISKHTPYRQTHSTPAQGPSWMVPEVSPLIFTPIPLRTSVDEEPPIPGRPWHGSPFAIAQRSPRASPVKPEPASVLPSGALGLPVSQPPFPTEKIQRTKVYDTLRQTQELQDSFDVEPLVKGNSI